MKGVKTGGRRKGTPNAIPAALKRELAYIVNNYFESGEVDVDLRAIENPKDRLLIVEKFLNYVLPKRSSIAMTDEDGASKTIEDTLRDLVEED